MCGSPRREIDQGPHYHPGQTPRASSLSHLSFANSLYARRGTWNQIHVGIWSRFAFLCPRVLGNKSHNWLVCVPLPPPPPLAGRLLRLYLQGLSSYKTLLASVCVLGYRLSCYAKGQITVTESQGVRLLREARAQCCRLTANVTGDPWISPQSCLASTVPV